MAHVCWNSPCVCQCHSVCVSVTVFFLWLMTASFVAMVHCAATACAAPTRRPPPPPPMGHTVHTPRFTNHGRVGAGNKVRWCMIHAPAGCNLQRTRLVCRDS
jgi:hypothetical protein